MKFHQLLNCRRKQVCVRELEIEDQMNNAELPFFLDLMEACGSSLTDLSIGWEDTSLSPYIRHRLALTELKMANLDTIRIQSESSPILSLVHQLLRLAPNVEDLQIMGPCQTSGAIPLADSIAVADWWSMPFIHRIELVVTPAYVSSMADLIGNCPNLVQLVIWENSMKWQAVDIKILERFWGAPWLFFLEYNVSDEKRLAAAAEMMAVPGCFPNVRELKLFDSFCVSEAKLYRVNPDGLIQDFDRMFQEIDFDVGLPSLRSMILTSDHLWTDVSFRARGITEDEVRRHAERFINRLLLERIILSDENARTVESPIRYEGDYVDGILARSYEAMDGKDLLHFRYTSAIDNSRITTLDPSEAVAMNYPRRDRIFKDLAMYDGKDVSRDVLEKVYEALGEPMTWTEPRRDYRLPQQCWDILDQETKSQRMAEEQDVVL